MKTRYDPRDPNDMTWLHERYGRWTASGTAWKCQCKAPYRGTHGQHERYCPRCHQVRPAPKR